MRTTGILVAAAFVFSPAAAIAVDISVERVKQVAIIGGCHDCHTDGYSESNGKVEGLRSPRMPTEAGEKLRPFKDLTIGRATADVKFVQVHDDRSWQMPANGDRSRAEWFEKLRTPSGQSCCKLSDCQRTQAEWRGDTQGWWAIVNGQWRPIPSAKVLQSPRTIDGSAYVCAGEDSKGDTRQGLGSTALTPLPGAVYCFVPPDLGS